MSNSEKIDIINRTSYYFDGIIGINEVDFDNFLLDVKSYNNCLIYHVKYTTTQDVNTQRLNPLRIRFYGSDRYIKKYDGRKY